MSILSTYRSAAAVAVVVLLAACSYVDPVLKPGWRHIVMTVENDSPRPATLFVAKDEQPMGELLGTAMPGTVPPGTTMDVTFGLPPEPGWAIFVNPVPQRDPMFGEHDVPRDASGRAPFKIMISVQGEVSAQGERVTPGWMGEP